MSETRQAFVALVRSHHCGVAEACRRYGISRKTGYKWLRRFEHHPERPLDDSSRRPHSSPAQTAAALEARILQVRDTYGWGARKIHAFLRRQGLTLPSPRTLTAVLRRHGRLAPATPKPPAPCQRFERSQPNKLWQLDFKGPFEIARQKYHLLNVLDDHSRYLLAATLTTDKAMASAWGILWPLFAEVGLPQAILCDHAFATSGGTRTHPGLSWFEARLLRLGIRPLHGRPYHPQTQGKIERWHGTLEREAWPRLRWDHPDHFQADLRRWRVEVYNAVRPHEALGDAPPAVRWRPSARPRPLELPAVTYAPSTVLRKVMHNGEISWRNCEILVGCGITGERVGVEERDGEVVVSYADKEIRRLRLDQLRRRAIV